jgi:hypothetical protein
MFDILFHVLQVLAVCLVAIAMALALAHALELPGKLRLTKDQYLAVQPIYYPGFTFGGAAEPLALLVTFLLLFYVSSGAPFWLTACAFLALLAMHGAYWLLTHPVNNFWLKDVELTGAGGRFFALDPFDNGAATADWTALRDRWEYSHVARAGLGLAALILIVAAVALS